MMGMASVGSPGGAGGLAHGKKTAGPQQERYSEVGRYPRRSPSRRETAAELLMSLTNLILQPLQDWQSIAAYTVARAAAQAIPSVSVAPAASAPSLPG